MILASVNDVKLYKLANMHPLLTPIDPSWQSMLETALPKIDTGYLQRLQQTSDWLPGPKNLFNAFSVPKSNVRYILFGESPYPRKASANGYAFWDHAVHDIWTNQGLSTAVNRATSLRNFIKMLLVADKALEPHQVSQPAIAALDKTHYVQTLDELFQNMLDRGFLLLNASLVLSDTPVAQEAQYWLPFMHYILTTLSTENTGLTLLLFGKIAQKLAPLLAVLTCPQVIAEHPYNISFIHNPHVIQVFQPLQLLYKNC